MSENRKVLSGKLIVASHNAGKVTEINDLVRAFGIETISAADLDLPEPEETGDTFIANAELKALAAAQTAGLPAIADDSGLAVDALGGAPGIHSARWAEGDVEKGETVGRDFERAMRKVEEALTRIPDAPRTAHFACALTLAWPDGHCESFEGKVFGELVWPPRGDMGFGYDPVFQPYGLAKTFGEIPPDVKHAMSHRAEAFQKLVTACLED
ncbi:MAG: non-canonical purine NTP pyrophosphatase, RdgB/HAM1 family [Rhodobiaceae bacterium]|nr:non-canonical purine NTP pyrophosphatase, RdgB/HAM1 family [Rhodobiaceae bacterium]